MSLAYSDFRSAGSSTSLAADARPSLREMVGGFGVLMAAWVLGYWVPNAVNQHRVCLPAWAAPWEAIIPYSVWMIIPYVTLNGLYVAAAFCCRSRGELQTLTRRVATTVGIAALFFLLLPTQYVVTRPLPNGPVERWLLTLIELDMPNNVFPSLHMAFAVVLAPIFMRPFTGLRRWVVAGWFVLICVSTLMTMQHHLLDAAAGGLLGWGCSRAIPHASPQTANVARRVAFETE